MNDECRICPYGRNCINGRWCEKVRKYVQYAKTKLCEDKITKTIEKEEQ